MKRLIPLFFLLPTLASADIFRVDDACNVHFSPKGGAEKAVVDLIHSAKQSIRVLAYSFTSKPIATALVLAKKQGVSVEVILDKSQLTARGTQLAYLSESGVPVWVDSKHAIAHNKVLIVDAKYFENGSFNYTAAAENSNGENALICPSVSGAAVYAADFERHKAHSERH